MLYPIRRSFQQAVIKLMVLSLLSSTLAGLIPPPLVRSVTPAGAADLVETLLPAPVAAQAAPATQGAVYLPAVANSARRPTTATEPPTGEPVQSAAATDPTGRTAEFAAAAGDLIQIQATNCPPGTGIPLANAASVQADQSESDATNNTAEVCNYLIIPPPTPNGVLTLTKTVVNSTLTGPYAVTVRGPNSYVTNTTVTAGAPRVLTGLAQGVYTVTETSPGAGWVTTYTVNSLSNSTSGVATLLNPSTVAAFTAAISGQVYRDFNSDGQITADGVITDTGVSGVTVTAYDVVGASVGSATSAADGTYTLNPTGAGPYRVEFSNLPSSYEPTTHGPSASSGANGTNVQFVSTAAGANNINLGINHPCDYCQSSPNLATTKFVNGDPLLTTKPGGGSVFYPTKDFPAWLQFPYSSGATGAAVGNNSPPASGTTAFSTIVNAGPIGTLWGLAYQRETKRMFGAAVVRRHAGLGPLGTGGIYMADLSGATPAISSFVNLAAAPFNLDTGTFASPRNLPIETADPSHDDEAFGLVGKAGLGGLDISADGKELWLVNLKTRTLHKLLIGNPAQAPTSASALTTPTGQPWLTASCTNGVERPWAVKVYHEKVYVGTVCTGENSGTAADVTGQVYEYDGATFTKLLTIPLNYTKGAVYEPSEDPGQWYPWLDTYTDAAFVKNGNAVRTQPILSAIEFDAHTGNMILGFTDRNGLQFAYQNYKPDGTTNTISGFEGGDILLACQSGGAWVSESNGQCPANSNPGATGAGDNQGPGGGEFFYDDRTGDATDPTNLVKGVHKDTHSGALAALPGANDVAMTAMDPFRFASAGVAWLNTPNGSNKRRYEIYSSSRGESRDRGSFAKAAGLGDLQLLCDPAPLEIGNRVWDDLDGDGVQDAGEPGLSGLQVSLQGPTNTVTTNTDADGLYYFNNLQSYTAYTLTVSGPAGYSLSAANQAALSGGTAVSNHAISDTIDSDAALVSGVATIYYSTGTAGQNNHGLDFGFTQPVKGQVDITNAAPKLDYGDLPDDDDGVPSGPGSPTSPGYNTNLTGTLGASHVITPGLRIGASEDNESNGQPNADATGDGADEDGVTLPVALAVGQNAVFTVTVLNTGTTSAVLYGFIDFNGDGNFNDPGEVVTATVAPNAASQTVLLTIFVPLNSYSAEQIGARFRLSTQTGLGGDGPANDGEVEDYLVQITATDWGDLPDASAGSATGPTYNTDSTGPAGPSHVIKSSLFLGSFEDAELTGQPNATATGDDSTPSGQADDEEGVTIPATLSAGQTAAFVVRAVNPLGQNATVYGFVDWNGDGDFNDGNETVSQPATTSGDVTLSFSIPLTATTTNLLGARFRLSTDAGLGPDGPASDGEVEDYLVRVGSYDFGDLPDGSASSPTGLPTLSPGYNTDLTGVPGPSHYIIPELGLGATEDNEIDGQPSADATGDGADEDALTFPTQIMAGNTAVFTATVRNSTGSDAVLYGFVDWNGDGDFSDVSETVIQSVSSAAGNQIVPLNFVVPLHADTSQQLGARFRLSTAVNLGPDGPASNGEVEDYLLQVVAFDLALRKTVTSLSTTPLAPGVSTVTYNLAVINQGTVAASAISLIDSFDPTLFQPFEAALNPAGTTTGDAALPYTWSNGVATLTGTLNPGQTVNLPITLRLAANTLGKTLANYAEIASATAGSGQPVTDIDSQPEADEADGNSDLLVDDAIDDNGTLDEDDHDVAYVSVKRFDLALIKTASSFSPAPLTPGVSVVTFTLTVFNQGDLTTTLPITVVDYPQVGFTFNAADNPGWDGTTATRPQRVLTQPIGPGGSITTQLVLRVDGNVTGGTTLYNFAEIADDGAPVDADSTPDASNDEAGVNPIDPTDDTVKDNVTAEDGKNVPGQDEDDHDVATVVVPVFDLALIKTVASQSGSPLVPGFSLVNFTLTVYNQGEVTAQAITLVDYVVPGDFVFDAGLNPTWGNTTPPAITLPGPLAPGESLSTTITLRVAAGSSGQLLDNYAEISQAQDLNGNPPTDIDSTPDTDDSNDGTPKDNNTAEFRKLNPTDDEDDHDLAVVTAGAFDLALVKRVAGTSQPLLPGGLVTFTVEVFNQGDISALAPITVVDYVQTGFSFAAALNPAWNGANATSPVITIPTDIAPGQSVTTSLVLRVNTGTAGQTLNNYAEIADDGIETDRDSTPDTTNSETPVKDDVTLENGKLNPGVDDEDDHDGASVQIPLPLALGNYVWLDLNRDGLQTGESGLAGATVALFQVLQGGAIITPAKDIDGVLVPSLTTAADGLYQFANLAPGEYTVRVTPPAGYAATQGGSDPDNDDNTDSNGVPVANQPYVESLPVLLTVAGEPAGDDLNQGGVDENGNGTVDFGFVERRDWGDLPDGLANLPVYNTDSAGPVGASHLLLPGLSIGTVEDDEVDGQPSITATGDDNIPNTQPDDEEGVTLPPTIVADTTATFTVTVVNTRTAAATLYGFVDWNGDGDFADLGETATLPVAQSAVSQSVLLTFTVPATATTTVEVGARFRLSSDAALGPDGPASDGEVEDYLVKVAAYDWGDLPDGNANNSPNYPTSNVNAGPSHQIIPGLGIGAVEDNETNGQPNSTATGDDNAGLVDDEDGVQIPANIQQGQSIVITVTVLNATGSSATLYGFVDWNGDGDFDDASESLIAPANSSGNVLLNFTVPLTATITQAVGARFRLSSDAGLGPVGRASNGEVEDYLLRVGAIYDFGDLPDGNAINSANYQSLLANNGPSHAITPTLRLGAVEDNEADGQPSNTATGDDNNPAGQVDDEDGITLPTAFIAGASATVTATVLNNTDKDATLYGFVDWNADGDFSDLSESVSQLVSASASSQNVPLTFSVPATATTTSLLGARFRLSTDTALGPNGPASDGEVEDYLITVTAYDHGDLPDDDSASGSPLSPGYNTNRSGTAGAAHLIIPGLAIGASEDAEPDGQPDAAATGDDNVGSAADDEDGVTFPASLYPGQSAVITVTAVNTTGQAATLYGFIDWNGDGDFSDANETVSQLVSSSGTVLLNFNIPATATITQSLGARFRLSTDTGLGADGLASNGEVEDYLVKLTPPLSLGNRVWEDLNNNGVVDGGEPGINGVRVKLYAGDGVTEIEVGPDGILGTADDAPGGVLTNATGHYLFAQLPPGDYLVEVTQPDGYTSSTGANASSTGAYEPAPDEDTSPADNDDNGTASPSSGGTVRSAVVTLSVTGEPTSEADLGDIINPATDSNSNLQVDFGFYQPLSLGNEVWIDANNDGLRQGLESYVADGVLVNLYFDADNNGQLNGAETTPISSTTTVAGMYLFAQLRAGNYLVELAASNFQTGGLLVGYASSVGANGVTNSAYEGALTPDPDTDATDGDDNGSTVGVLGSGGSIRSALITLTVGDEASDEQPDNDAFTPDRNENLTVDFGVFRPLSLGNLIWNDRNNDGLYDPDGADDQAGTADDEAGLDNVVVELLDSLGNVVSTTNTANGGRYLFPNLTPGDYTVRVTPPPGYVSSTGTNGEPTGPFEAAPDPDADDQIDNDDNGTADSNSGQIVALPVTLAHNSEPIEEEPDNDPLTPDANENLTVDFGLFLPAALGNRVWYDVDKDGVQDAGETGVPGVLVRLYISPTLVVTTTTDGTGHYTFTNLMPGNYVVEFGLPPGYVRSPQDNAGSTPDGEQIDSDADPVTGQTVPINLTPGETDLTWDAGIYFDASLGDRVWFDQNANGLQDANEPGVPKVTVTLLDITGNAVPGVTPVQTDDNGFYVFPNLSPNDYYVQFTLPNGYVFTQPDVGGNNIISDTMDSDVNPVDSRTALATLEPNEHDPTWDAGIYLPVSLGNLVWEDKNNNGVVDSGEPGIANVVVKLYAADGVTEIPVGPDGILGTADDNSGNYVTNANGNYLFTNLKPGDYVVGIVAPVGYTSSTGVNSSVSGPYEPASDPDNDHNNDDNGSITSGTVASGQIIKAAPVTLVSGGEPAAPVNDDGDSDATSNLTVDFGLYQPLNLGNLVWFDINNDGLADSDGLDNQTGTADDEVGLAVTVQLYAANSTTLITSTQTNSSGHYLFTNLTAGEYIVAVVKSTVPPGYVTSTGANGSLTGPNEPAPDEDTTVLDNDDNGSAVGPLVVTAAVTLTVGAEPLNEADRGDIINPVSDANSNTQVDFGFYLPLSLGNLVWEDRNNNGVVDEGEPGVDDVVVKLYAADGTTLIAQTLTDNTGHYRFDHLAPGDYVVVVNGPLGYISSTGVNGSASGPYEAAPDPDNDINNDDNGTVESGEPATGVTIISSPVTLSVGNEPAAPAKDDEDSDSNTNLTVDFGLFKPLSLGNLVWHDVNNDGKVNNGETGIPEVTVNLYGADGSTLIATTTTNATGHYLFTNLNPGDYIVEVVQSSLPVGYVSSTGQNGSATGPYEPAPAEDSSPLDNDDNGSITSGTLTSTLTVRSALVTLSASSEPQTEPDLGDIFDNAQDANSNLQVDFGFFVPARLGDRVWLDHNRDGVQDAGEVGVPGVTVRLYDSADKLVATTTTGQNGLYLFDNLSPGDYVVEFALPIGYARSPQDTGGNTPISDTTDSDADLVTGRTGPINLSEGETDPTWDAGIYFNASLGDRVWYDRNGDGLQDAGESGVPGVQVTLFNSLNQPVGEPVLTDQNGNYAFPDLPPGDYYVQFTLPTGYIFSPQNTGGNTTFSDALDSDVDPLTGKTLITNLELNEHDPTWDAGIYEPVSLGNLVWIDSNNNGKVDAGEPGLADVNVQLFRADGTPVGAPIQTDQAGHYLFTNLPPGKYYVEIEAPAGYASSTGLPGSFVGLYEPAPSAENNRNDDDNGSNTTGSGQVGGVIRSSIVTLTPGQEPVNDEDSDANSNLTVDFGLYPVVSVGDQVWLDNDGDGVQDSGEPGVPDVKVTLYNATTNLPVLLNGTPLSTLTDSSGLYLFEGLPPGNYYVIFDKTTLPAGYVITPANMGADDKDSDADSNGRTPSTGFLAGGSKDLTLDLGIYQPVSVGDYVWIDSNDNGLQDAGEPGVKSVQVTLYDATSGTPVVVDGKPLTQVTDGSGHYLFADLPPGAYYVVFDLTTIPAGYIPVLPNQGADDQDSDADGTGKTPATGFLASGQHNLTLDLGLIQPPNLVLSKAVNKTEVAPGDVIRYTLVYTNTGSSSARSTVLTETVPTGTTFEPTQSTAGWQCANNGAAGASCRLTLGDVAPGQTGQVVYAVKLGTNVSAFSVIPNVAVLGTIKQEVRLDDNDDRADVRVQTPQAVTLALFNAETANGAIILRWQTGVELRTAGYHIYRSKDGLRRNARQLTTGLIPSLGVQGGDYSYTDRDVEMNQIYTYWIVEVDDDGNTHEYGPLRFGLFGNSLFLSLIRK